MDSLAKGPLPKWVALSHMNLLAFGSVETAHATHVAVRDASNCRHLAFVEWQIRMPDALAEENA